MSGPGDVEIVEEISMAFEMSVGADVAFFSCDAGFCEGGFEGGVGG